MQINWIDGNIFTTQLQTIVNTVNTQGVMGAGLALECRLRYPEMFLRYKELCEKGLLDIGQLWIYRENSDRWILNFPTKKNWKLPSKEVYLHLGLEKFLSSYEEKGITSVAFPLLGADRGGLPRKTSELIISEYLSDLTIPVEVYRYNPHVSDDLFTSFKGWFLETGKSHISNETSIRKDILEKIELSLLESNICQINQLGKVQGIGLKTLEKIFAIMKENREFPKQRSILP